MNKNRVVRQEDRKLAFFCPGCNFPHYIEQGPWTWNNDQVHPTFLPSVLVKRRMGNFKPIDDPDFEYHDEVCHSFVTQGEISFLSDCTHELAGKKVMLPEWPYDEEV